MRLKQQLIKNIEQLSAMELILVHNFIQILTRQEPQRLKKRTILKQEKP
jgi:hypothetical protein